MYHLRIRFSLSIAMPLTVPGFVQAQTADGSTIQSPAIVVMRPCLLTEYAGAQL